MSENDPLTQSSANGSLDTVARMEALERFGILDTERDAIFDSIADLAAALLDAPIAVVNFVANDRQFFKAEIGIGARELPLDVSICRLALPEGGLFVVPDLATDDRFDGNPLIHVQDGLRFYAGFVLASEGIPVGTVCVLDRKARPNGLTAAQEIGLKALGTQALAALERSAEARRDRFVLALTDQMQDVDGPVAMMEAAAKLLGRHLRVSQVGFGEVGADQAHIRVDHEWNAGPMMSVLGRWRMDDFGEATVAALKTGQTIVIDDVREDARSNGAVASASYAAVGARSVVVVPLVRAGMLDATLFIHHHEPRRWHGQEIALIEDTATRLWGAVLRARADVDIEKRSRELEALIGTAPIGFAYFDREHRYLRINGELAEINGIPAADHIGVSINELLPVNGAAVSPILNEVFATGKITNTIEVTGDTPLLPGVERHWLTSWFPVLGDDGDVVSVGAWVVEITDRKRAEEAQRASEARLRQAQALGGIGSWEWNHSIGEGSVSESYKALHGMPEGSATISSDDLLAVMHHDDQPAFREAVLRGIATGERITVNYRVTLPSGEMRNIRGVGQRVGMDEPAVTAGIVEDVTKRRTVEARLAESEVKYRAAFEQAGVGVARVSLDGPFLEINDRYCEILGRERTELVGEGWKEITHPDDLGEDVANVERLLAGHGANYTMEKRYIGKDGEPIWVNLTISLARDAMGAPAFFVAVAEDIAARKQAEMALADSEARLRAVIEAAPVGLVFANADGEVTGGNARVEEIIGHQVLPSPNVDAYGEWIGFHPDGRQVEAREYPLARIVLGEADRAELEVLYQRGDGRKTWIRFIAAAMRAADGALIGGVVASLDIDREKRLTNELEIMVSRAVEERETALAQLHEAQKLETIGQLTGGVAHDFNNLLTPIMGVLEMMEHRVAGEERTKRLVSGALQSTERAKNLVQRLLAFARRQHLETKPIDLEALIEGMRDLIDRSIGPTITVEVVLEPSLGAVTADANQLELALLNLSVNARDAMPNGGTLRFEARQATIAAGEIPELAAGLYVCLSVSDTGTGMDSETLRRCIEPFYTSKGVGEGTGLGLSMVHGMMRQLGGALVIASAPEQGTTMELWLVRSDAAAKDVDAEQVSLTTAPRRSTILLVDDDELVRESTADMLDRLGYDVIQADGGARALELLDGRTSIDALVTDYLMPGMTGRELAERARRDRPQLPVLLITGYTRLDEIGTDLARLEKPFRQADFATRVAQLVAMP